MDPILGIVFLLVLSSWLYYQRKHVIVQKILYPVIYFVMYRTKIGLSAMETMAKRWKRTIAGFGYLGIVVGFLGMGFIAVELVKNVITILSTQEAIPGVGLVLPIQMKGVFFVPFVYWVVSIFFVAVVHEFAHGVVSRRHGIPIKSSGLAFLGVIIPVLPAAFVEPDEKKLVKKSTSAQLSVFAAGPMSNIMFGFVFLALFLFVMLPVASTIIELTGLEVTAVVNATDEGVGPAYAAGIREGMVITSLDDQSMSDLSEFSAIIESYSPGDTMSIRVGEDIYQVELGSHPEDAEKAYLGISVTGESDVTEAAREAYGVLPDVFLWFLRLVYWLFLLNFGIGIFNLVPLGPIDGGRMLNLVLCKWIGDEWGVKVWKFVSVVYLALLLFIIGSSFFA